MTIEEINKEIERLLELKRELESKKYEEMKSNAEKYIGKYFHHNIYNDAVPIIGRVQDVNIQEYALVTELTYDECIPSLDGDYSVTREIKDLNFISKEEFISMLEDRLEMIRNAWRGK